MDDREAVQMMQRCASEIRDLRAEVERLRPKAEAYDNLAIALHFAQPRQGGIMGEDLLWTLDDRIRQLNKAEEAKAKAAARPMAQDERETPLPDMPGLGLNANPRAG